MPVVKKKLVVVGDGCTGKTCLLVVFNDSKFPHEYIPTVFENHVAEVELDNQRIQLQIWDTAGQEDYDRLRPLSYPLTDVVLICFSISVAISLDHVESKWIKEVREHLPNVPVILVGNMIDLRDDHSTVPGGSGGLKKLISTETGKKMARRINAHSYLECSALKNQGVQEIFQVASKAAISYELRSIRKRQCVLL